MLKKCIVQFARDNHTVCSTFSAELLWKVHLRIVWSDDRVQPGYCFHLFTKYHADALEDYQLPEMLRTPLEELCLQIKVFTRSDTAIYLSAEACLIVSWNSYSGMSSSVNRNVQDCNELNEKNERFAPCRVRPVQVRPCNIEFVIWKSLRPV